MGPATGESFRCGLWLGGILLGTAEVKVRLYGDTAVVTYRSTAKGKDQQGAIDEQRRWTRVSLWRDGRWQLVHSQGTPIQKP